MDTSMKHHSVRRLDEWSNPFVKYNPDAIPCIRSKCQQSCSKDVSSITFSDIWDIWLSLWWQINDIILEKKIFRAAAIPETVIDGYPAYKPPGKVRGKVTLSKGW